MRLISAVSGVQVPAPPPEIIKEFVKNSVPRVSPGPTKIQQIEGCERLTHTPFYVSEKALVQSWIRAFVLGGELFIFRYKYVLTLRHK